MTENNNSKWPTLEGRLKQRPTSEFEALEQFERCHLEAGGPELSEWAKKRLEKYRRKAKPKL